MKRSSNEENEQKYEEKRSRSNDEQMQTRNSSNGGNIQNKDLLKRDHQQELGDCEQDDRQTIRRENRPHYQAEFDQDNSNSERDCDKPKRNPFCSRCRNHGKSAQVRGHKRHCEYRDCECEGCGLVKARQMISAAQIRQRRNQKQDEEWGRKIEVSPPVMSRSNNSDPVSLLAKSLINKGSSRRDTTLPSTAPKQPLTAAVLLSNQIDPVNCKESLYSNNVHDQARHRDDTHVTQNNQILASVNSNPMYPGLVSSVPINESQISLNSESSIQNSHVHTRFNSNNHFSEERHPHHPQDQVKLKTKSMLNNAYEFFHLTNPTLLTASGKSTSLEGILGNLSTQANQQQSATTSIPSALVSSPMSSRHSSSTSYKKANGSLDDYQQLEIVESIAQTFGPLAIYAWLKAEQFDVEKVRHHIEISRQSYNDLLDLKSRRNTTMRNNRLLEAHIQTTSNSVSSGGGVADSRSGSSSRSSCMSINGPTDQAMSKKRTIEQHIDVQSMSATDQTNTTSITSNSQSLANNSSSSSSIYTFGVDPLGYINNNNLSFLNCHNSNNKNIATSQAAAVIAHRARMEAALGAKQMDHSLTSDSQNIFWPGLELTQNALASNSMIHPHHFLPHLMHHQSLLARHQSDQHHSLHQSQHSLTFPETTPTNSNLLAPSSSTLL